MKNLCDNCDNILNKINVLLAKLKPSQYREYWKVWNAKFRDRYRDIFGDKYRIYLEYPDEKAEEDVFRASLPEKYFKNAAAINKFLIFMDPIHFYDNADTLKLMTIRNYLEGNAVNERGQTISVLKLIQKIRKMYDRVDKVDLGKYEVKDKYYNRLKNIYSEYCAIHDPTPFSGDFFKDLDQTINCLIKIFNQRPSMKEYVVKKLVCISRHPYDIAGMSTDRRWTSCMNLNGGAYYKKIKEDIKYGTLIAYLIYADDKNINKPIARIAIKPYQNVSNPEDILLVPEPEVYSDNKYKDYTEFKKIVKEWVDSFQQEKTGMFLFNEKLYRDKSDKIIVKESKNRQKDYSH